MAKGVKVYIQTKLFNPLIEYLKQGLSPEKMALTFAISLVVGVIPVWGAVTALCFILALVLRLNFPAMLVITTFTTPLQIFGYVPFIELGVGIFGGETIDLSYGEMVYLIRTDFRKALAQMGYANLMGVFAWLGLALPSGIMIYHTSRPMFQKLAASAVEEKPVLE